MSLTDQIEETVFHDADLVRCSTAGDTLTLQFRNIALEWGQEEYYSAVVVLSGVREVRRFDKPVAQLLSEGEGADVLQFRPGEGTALLLVEWIYYRQPINNFAKYEIDYATSSIIVEKQEELIV